MLAAPNATGEYIDDGKDPRIFLRSWQPDTSPRAVVVICHGFNSHSGYYHWTAGQFTSRGYAVYAPDLRGRGHSDGERFFVTSMEEYVADLARAVNLATARHPDLPIFLLGHSAGGVTSALYVLDHPGRLAGFICEGIAYQLPAPDFAVAVLRGLSHVAPHAHVLRLRNADFSRDPAVVAAMDADPLLRDEVQPTSTVAALSRADMRLKQEFVQFASPLLILHGTADRAAKHSGSQEFYDHASSTDKELKLYEGRFHDLLNDVGREQVMADILDWLNARANAALALAETMS